MQFLVKPSPLESATVSVPGDKSVSHRAVMLGSIAEGRSRVAGFLAGEDCLATMAAFQAMGVEIERTSETELIIHGRGLHGLEAPTAALDLGNSGTAMRLMGGLLAGQAFPTVLTGDESLSSLANVYHALPEAHAKVPIAEKGLPQGDKLAAVTRSAEREP